MHSRAELSPGPTASSGRIPALDLIRGVAVMGILAINIANFAAPDSASFAPDRALAPSPADYPAFVFNLIVFEGKMRALFSILFGASLLLFVERRDAAGLDGEAFQRRRLGWLLLFGYLHFALLWDGDILFLYAAIGFVALGFRHLSPRWLVGMALAASLFWQAWGTAAWTSALLQEHQALEQPGNAAAQQNYQDLLSETRERDQRDRAEMALSWPAEVVARLGQRAGRPVNVVLDNWGETLPLMLLGMALLKSGFFAGLWQRRWVAGLGIVAGTIGLAANGLFVARAMAMGWPPLTMHWGLGYAMALPHALAALSYASLLVLATPLLLRTGLGNRIAAAGKMAFSNYIGTTVLMTALFNGWGLGLFGQFGPARLWLFVLLGWVLILGLSAPWLARFRQGPLEWLWRSLTEKRLVSFRKG